MSGAPTCAICLESLHINDSVGGRVQHARDSRELSPRELLQDPRSPRNRNREDAWVARQIAQQREGSFGVYTLRCGHAFHQGCILPWVQHKQQCPVCKEYASPPSVADSFHHPRHNQPYTQHFENAAHTPYTRHTPLGEHDPLGQAVDLDYVLYARNGSHFNEAPFSQPIPIPPPNPMQEEGKAVFANMGFNI